jgi:hypothetical protein
MGMFLQQRNTSMTFQAPLLKTDFQEKISKFFQVFQEGKNPGIGISEEKRFFNREIYFI